MVIRLYKINKSGKKTGTKRDYPSEEHFLKYGKETYERYDKRFFGLTPTETKAELCFLNELNKWEKFNEFDLENLLNKFK